MFRQVFLKNGYVQVSSPRSGYKPIYCHGLLAILSALLLFTAPRQAAADPNAGFDASNSEIEPQRARLSANENPSSFKRLKFSPLNLQGGSTLTLISPEPWLPLAKKLSSVLTEAHAEYSGLFGEIPPFVTSMRLMDEDTFYLVTGAPKWTNAMFYRGQIIIPLSASAPVDYDNIYRSVRHEYTHAIIHALSGGRCPGWLDEGLAQWAEGTENPALQPALLKWLDRNRPVPLSLLQGGFTRLNADMVPAAYAQSLFAANTVINTFGFSPMRRYFDGLRKGKEKETAFDEAFQMSEEKFEKGLGYSLKRWSEELE